MGGSGPRLERLSKRLHELGAGDGHREVPGTQLEDVGGDEALCGPLGDPREGEKEPIGIGDAPDAEPGEASPGADGRPLRRENPKVGRNDPCVCGSGKKYKQCCGKLS